MMDYPFSDINDKLVPQQLHFHQLLADLLGAKSFPLNYNECYRNIDQNYTKLTIVRTNSTCQSKSSGMRQKLACDKFFVEGLF